MNARPSLLRPSRPFHTDIVDPGKSQTSPTMSPQGLTRLNEIGLLCLEPTRTLSKTAHVAWTSRKYPIANMRLDMISPYIPNTVYKWFDVNGAGCLWHCFACYCSNCQGNFIFSDKWGQISLKFSNAAGSCHITVRAWPRSSRLR